MVYGIGPRMPGNIETWQQHGYITHVMTGVAWGQYQDYLNGAVRWRKALGPSADREHGQADPARRQREYSVYLAGRKLRKISDCWA